MMRIDNRSTRLYVTIQGFLIGLVGIIHGVSSTLQGNRPTEGMLLKDVGAFTLIPNYLFTGIAAILVGLCISVWAVWFVHTQHGATIFLLLSFALFFVGGSIAVVPVFLLAWGVATQIRQPLTWWRKTLPESSRKQLAKMWRLNFAAGYLFFSVGVFIWLVFTPPWMAYEDKAPAMLYLSWANLLIGLVFQVLSIVSGFARDIQIQDGESHV
jgi:hypothetical protein